LLHLVGWFIGIVWWCTDLQTLNNYFLVSSVMCWIHARNLQCRATQAYMYTADEANQNNRNTLFSISWNTHNIKIFHIKLHVLMKSIYIIHRTNFCIISQLGENWQLYNYQLKSILHSYWTFVHDLGQLHSIYTTQNQIYQTTSCAFCHKLYFTKIFGVVGWGKIPQYTFISFSS